MAVLSDDFAAKCMERGLTREQVGIVAQVLAEDPKLKALVLMNGMDRDDPAGRQRKANRER